MEILDDYVPNSEPKPEPKITAENCGWDFEEVCGCLSAEMGGEPYEGQVAVAQCIKNSADRMGITPEEVINMPHRYTKTRRDPDLVRKAAEDVFFNGVTITNEPIEYMYSVRGGLRSKWHENSCVFVMQLGDVRFFKSK